MRVFVVDENLKKQVKLLVDFAEANPFTLDEIRNVAKGEALPAGGRQGYSITAYGGIRIVYSVEQQKPGDVRHLTVSVDKDHSFPNPEIVKEIMSLIGFEKSLEECIVNIEKYSEFRGAVSVREIKGK